VAQDLVAQSQGLVGLTAGGPTTAEALNAVIKQINSAPPEEQQRLAAAAGVLLSYALYADKPGEATVDGDQATVKLQARPLDLALVKKDGQWQVDLVKTLEGMPLGVRNNAALLLGALFVAPPPAAAAATEAQADPVMELDDNNFAEKVENAQGLVLVDFFATWCGPCQAMKPIFHQFAAERREQMKFASLDVDQGTATARKYQIEAIPTLVLFRDGQKVAERVGYCSAAQLKALVTPFLQ
jgi:thioredoxin 1